MKKQTGENNTMSTTNTSITSKLVRLSNALRNRTSNPRYGHQRVIARSGLPYLKFVDFDIIYLESTRTYQVIFTGQVVIFTGQTKRTIGTIPKRGSTYEYKYLDKSLINLEIQYRSWMSDRPYKGSLYI